MNSNKFGTYVLVGLIMLDVILLLLNFMPVSLNLSKITGLAMGIPQTMVPTTVFVFGVPEPPNLTAWLENLNGIGYQNGTDYLNWTPSPSENVANYLLYETLNYSEGFNFTTPVQTFSNTTLNSSDSNASYYQHIYYILRSNTTYDKQDSNNNTWGKFTRQLYKNSQNRDVNLVSTPVILLNTSLYAVFIQNTSNYQVTEVHRRNDKTGEYDSVFYYGFLGYDIWYGQFYDFEPGYGYWVKVVNDFNFSMVGEANSHIITKQIYNTTTSGNLIGWTSVMPGNIDVTVNNSLTDYNITQIHRRNDLTGEYDSVFYYGFLGYDIWYGQFYDFEPGYGYWVITEKNMTFKYTSNVK